MKKILLNAVLIFGIILTSLYLSFPMLLQWGVDKAIQFTGYSFDMKGMSLKFPSVQIHKIKLTEKKTNKETEFSNFRFDLNLNNLMQGEIAFSKVAVDEIKNLDVKGSFFLKSLKLIGDVNCESFHLCVDATSSSGKVFLHALKIADRSFSNVMIDVAKEGDLKILSRDIGLEGKLLKNDNQIFYDLFLKSRFINFLGRNMIHVQGKYLFENAGIQGILKSYFYNDMQAQIDLKLEGDLKKLSITPTKFYVYDRDFILDPSHNLIVLKSEPLGFFGGFDFVLDKFDVLGEFISGKPEKTFLKISGTFDRKDYNINIVGNKLLLGSFLKASDFNLSVDSKKQIELHVSNKEKTNFLLKGLYENSKIKNIVFQGDYAGVSIKTNRTEVDFDKIDIDLSVGKQGKFFLKSVDGKIQVTSKKIPASILNNAIKDQNILFEDGFLNFDGEYKNGDGFLSVKMTGLKASVFEGVFGKVDFDAKLAAYALSSDFKMEWGKEGFLSAKYITPDVRNKIYDPLLSSYDVKGDLKIDGLSDFLKMHDDTLSGTLELSLKKTSEKFPAFNLILKNGYLEHAGSGIVLKNVDLKILKEQNDDGLSVTLKCDDDSKGNMNGHGHFSLTPSNDDMNGAAKLILNNFKILNNQKYQTSGNGYLDIILSPKEKKISGEVVIKDFLGYMMPKKDFEIIDIKIAKNQEKNIQVLKSEKSDVVLDIHFSIPKNSFRFYGSGLESNWAGDLKMKGTLTSPYIDGRLDAFNGYFVIAGKKLTFLKGYFLFENTLDPYIYVLTDANANNIDAKVVYQGLLSDAKLDIISIPSLPKEEAIAQILFSKSASQIKSSVQIIQLTDALAIFNGGKAITAFLDKFRQLGIDEIGIREDSSDGIFKTSPQNDQGVFSVGKNLGERFFVRADRSWSLSADAKTRGVIGVKLTPELSLEAIGEKSDQMDYGIGLEWKKDF